MYLIFSKYKKIGIKPIFYKWRRARDSNPRAPKGAVFKTDAIDHSASSPCADVEK